MFNSLPSSCIVLRLTGLCGLRFSWDCVGGTLLSSRAYFYTAKLIQTMRASILIVTLFIASCAPPPPTAQPQPCQARHYGCELATPWQIGQACADPRVALHGCDPDCHCLQQPR